MSYAYIDGKITPKAFAMTHIEDRGYQFADAVYEVVAIIEGRMIDLDGHLRRLWRSLCEMNMPFYMTKRCLALKMMELVRGNHVYEGNLYLQISRGVGARSHSYNHRQWHPILVMVTNQLSHGIDKLPKPQKVITTPDIRWLRRDIKTTCLLPNCMAATEAAINDAYEAWQVDDKGKITEGSHSNAWIVTKNNEILTRKADNEILNGITRLSVMQLMEEGGFSVKQRGFSVAEAYGAKEAFLTSSGGFVKPIGRIDDKTIGDGKIGEVCTAFFKNYRDYCRSDRHPSAYQPLPPSAIADKELPLPELVLFDWDNTLVDTFPVIKMAMSNTLKALGRPPFDPEEQKLAMNLSARDRFPILFGDGWQEVKAMYLDSYEKYAKGNLKPLHQAESYLKYLQARGIPMGLISNKRGGRLRLEVAELGWEDYFIASTGAEDAKADKPSPAIFRQFLKTAGIKAPKDSKKIWMVGDSQADMSFAENIGATAIYIGDGGDFRAKFGNQLADFVACYCDKVEDLKKIF